MNGETDRIIPKLSKKKKKKKKKKLRLNCFSDTVLILCSYINPSPAEPGYART